MYPGLSPAVKKLLIINIAVYIFLNVLKIDFNKIFPFELAYHNFGPDMIGNFNPLQLITYQFMHANFYHLFSNMFGLYMFGTMIEMAYGENRMWKLYLYSGIGAALLSNVVGIVELKMGRIDVDGFYNIGMVGASGAIFGIMGAFAAFAPNRELMIIPIPVPIKAKYLIALYAIFEMYNGINKTADGIAHYAHIGGLIIGLEMVRTWKRKGIGRW